MNPGWLPYVEAVQLKADQGWAWLLHAYLDKHDGRWVRYADESERRTEFSTPCLYLVQLWAGPAIEEAKRRAFTECGRGEDYWAVMNRIAYEITQRPEYPKCEELEEVWRGLTNLAGVQ